MSIICTPPPPPPPPLPVLISARYTQRRHRQAVDAAVDVLAAYLSCRSTMGAEEGASICSALAERALCCGRGPVECKADSAATVLLGGDVGELARRGGWFTLAARAGGLENEFFPPPVGEDEGRGRKKAAIAAAAPKAVAGCVRAISAGVKGRGVVAGGGDCRKEVRVRKVVYYTVGCCCCM